MVLESETAIEWDRISALDGVSELQPFLDSPAGFGETNFHVAGGNQQLIDALVRQLPDGTVWTDKPVSSVRDVGHQVVVRHDRGRNLDVLRCDHVVLAVPLWSLNAIALDAELEPAARAAIRSCTAGTYVKVQHGFGLSQPACGSGTGTASSRCSRTRLPGASTSARPVRGVTWSSPSSSTRSTAGSSARCRGRGSLDMRSEPSTT